MDNYTHTHITWEQVDPDDPEAGPSTYAHVIPGREQAADEVRKLLLSPQVYAIRVLEYPRADSDRISAHRRLPMEAPVSRETEPNREGQYFDMCDDGCGKHVDHKVNGDTECGPR
jgi:hypothetical protein